MTAFPGLTRQSWPVDPSGKDAFYGNPRGPGGGASVEWEAANLTTFTYPWHEQGAQSYRIHVKVKPSLMRVLNAIWDYVGHDQAKIAAAHINETGGTYDFRANVNNPSQLSNHSYGIAVDLAPDENPNRKPWVDDGTMLPRWVIEAFKAEGWRWGGDFSGVKDAMHFEAVFDQHHDQPPVPAPAPLPPPVPAVAAAAGQVTLLPPDPRLAAIQGLLLENFGLRSQLDAFKAKINSELAAVAAEINAFQLGVEPPPGPPVVLVPPAPAHPPALPPPAPAPAAAAPPSKVNSNITATVFGGRGDPNRSAYDRHLISDTELGCALPFRFTGARPLVDVTNVANGRTVRCAISDVGPWYDNRPGWPYDPYWVAGTRPRAETDARTNQSGIDLTVAAAAALGIDGKGKVSWSFVSTPTGVAIMSNGTPTPSTVTVPVASPLASKINWTALVQIAGTLLTVFSGGKLNLSPETQVAIVGFIGTVAPLMTIAFRTWGTTTITPQSLPSS